MGNSLASGAGAVLSGDPRNAFSAGDESDGYSYLPWVDLICAGVPCQDVSVAGKRAGLHGERTGLFFDFARLLRELRPTWFVFENVPGLLSSNAGRDFAEVLRVLMVECGYGVCWRVLDSQFFGVAQRRRRLYVVGRFGKPCPAEVLFEREGVRGGAPTSGSPRGETVGTLTAGAHPDSYNGQDAYTGHLLAIIQDVRGHREKKQHGIGISESGPCYTLDSVSQHAVAFGRADALDEERAGIEQHAAVGMDGAICGPDGRRAETDAERVGDFAGLPTGMDSARYRALGNAVTTKVARWIAENIRVYLAGS